MPNFPENGDLETVRVCEDALVGPIVVRPLECLTFEHESIYGTRAPILGNVKRLLHRFQKEGCRRQDPLCWIPAELSPADLQHVLSFNSLQGLDKNRPQEINLPSQWNMRCMQGQHRVAAALQWLDPNDQWWILNLYDSSKLTCEARRRLREGDSSSREFSDGEIYRNVRHYQKQGDHRAAGEWLARWSESKCREFRQLHKAEKNIHHAFRDSLDDLLPFPGLWPHWQMGTHLLRMRCPEELASGASDIYNAYCRLTLNHPEWLDAGTVEHLQGRCPKLSKADRSYIQCIFKEGLAFPDVTDSHVRDSLYQAAISYPRLIPSLKTFLENAKYLRAMTYVIKDFLPSGFQGTIMQAMRRCYVSPTNHRYPIQTSENNFLEKVNYRRDYGFWSAYRQIFLYAMRNFFGMTSARPLGLHQYSGPRQQPDSHELWRRFHDLASKLGFVASRTHPKVSKRAVQRPPEFVAIYNLLTRLRPAHLFEYDDSVLITEATRSCDALMRMKTRPLHIQRPCLATDAVKEWTLEHRCGMTHVETFFSDQEYLFLYNIYAPGDEPPRENITSFAVKQDMFLAFFGAQFEEDEEVEQMDDQDQLGTSGEDLEPPNSRTKGKGRDLTEGNCRTENQTQGPPVTSSTSGILSAGSDQVRTGNNSRHIPEPQPPESFPRPSTHIPPTVCQAQEISGDLLVGPITVELRGSCTCDVDISAGAFFAYFSAQVKPSPSYAVFYNLGKKEISCLLYSHESMLLDLLKEKNASWLAKPAVVGESIVLSIVNPTNLFISSAKDDIFFFDSTGTNFQNDLLLPDAKMEVQHAIDMPFFDEDQKRWEIRPGELEY
ncbi:hypothetical protein BBP40_007917 [Aspergillus hancockii]|nr:hypothetical protein BBP40_007917 [Aspergillus hancockii]